MAPLRVNNRDVILILHATRAIQGFDPGGESGYIIKQLQHLYAPLIIKK